MIVSEDQLPRVSGIKNACSETHRLGSYMGDSVEIWYDPDDNRVWGDYHTINEWSVYHDPDIVLIGSVSNEPATMIEIENWLYYYAYSPVAQMVNSAPYGDKHRVRSFISDCCSYRDCIDYEYPESRSEIRAALILFDADYGDGLECVGYVENCEGYHLYEPGDTPDDNAREYLFYSPWYNQWLQIW